MSDRLQENTYITDCYGEKSVDATVFGCQPEGDPRMRDRATLMLFAGPTVLTMRMTHAECIALAALITKAAETIPEGLRK